MDTQGWNVHIVNPKGDVPDAFRLATPGCKVWNVVRARLPDGRIAIVEVPESAMAQQPGQEPEREEVERE